MRPVLTAGNITGYLNDAAIWDFVAQNTERMRGDVLDIGCGDMRYKSIIMKGGHVKSYTGLDLEPGKFGYSVKADLYWDGQSVPKPDNTYDSALLLEVIEHCPNPNIVVSEAYRLLRPKGMLLFSVPFLYPLHGMPYDYQRLTPSGLEKLMRDAGFTHVHLEASGSWDASLGQTLAIWIKHRPMRPLVRKVLRKLFVPLFRFLLLKDKKHLSLAESALMPGILGVATK